MEIIWTKHAEDRQKQWERKTRDGLLRAPFIEIEGKRKILTLYWTSKVGKYWKEEKNENKL